MMRWLTTGLLWLVSLGALAQVAPPVEALPPATTTVGAAPRIGIVMMEPGEIFFERFGHDSVLVADPETGEAISYNFGFFDPTEPDFIARFVRGDMRYRLAAVP